MRHIMQRSRVVAMHPFGHGLADRTSRFTSLHVGFDREGLGIYFHLIKAHAGEFKQKREGYHNLFFTVR